MLSRLRLLKLSPLEIPPKLQILNTINLINPIRNPKTTKANCKNNGQQTFFSTQSHKEKQREVQSFSTQSTDMDEPAGSSIYSPYVSVRIRCNKDVAEILSEALLCFGANSASMDELDYCRDLGNTWITSIFTNGQDVHACISHAADSIGLDHTPTYELSMGKPYNWAANIQLASSKFLETRGEVQKKGKMIYVLQEIMLNSKETFHPTEVTDGLWIVPKWRTPLDSQAINIILDPGLSFGTGEHPTTKLCLLLLRGWIKGGEHFFDYGTGSGVLGIAALKMGAAYSVGIDTDPQAVASACRNIALNEMDSSKMSVYLVSSNKNLEEQPSDNLELIASKQKFDIIIANILLNPLLDLVDDIISFGKPGALVGLSGILSEQVPQIKELYSQYLENMSISEMDGWACLHGTRGRK